MIHLDTHVAVRAYARRSRLSATALRLIERGPCQISPMTLLEIEMLFEMGRIPEGSATLLEGLGRQIGLIVSDAAFVRIVEIARGFAWTRDPFDRLIVANAIAGGARLITADATILEHFKDAVW